MAEHLMSSDDRPSFATFWRNSQNEDSTTKELTFVQSVPGQPSNRGIWKIPVLESRCVFLIIPSSSSAVTFLGQTEGLAWRYVIPGPRSGDKDLSPLKGQESEQTAKNKRRAQVRKAQVQHRQRKANYVKQLEANIAGIRDKIADAEGQSRVLASENEAMRAQLSGSASFGQAAAPGYDFAPVPSYEGFDIDPSFDMEYFPIDPNLSTAASTFDTIKLSPYANSGTGSSAYDSPQFLDGSGTSSPYPTIPEMGTDQPQQVMSFFLV
ncbi:bZIP transcription factor 17 [Cytospora mali]|uniref:BZIP transcription factor 17 n=1 Tax=Cytospora mali TaxID=578113 RepID=A0A194UQI6_CYTMA|nr:bZIP transcription factor 17 [Valsa mali var. pyri (nom. inval.)]